jgi:hypothetical protein
MDLLLLAMRYAGAQSDELCTARLYTAGEKRKKKQFLDVIPLLHNSYLSYLDFYAC